jgi:hypothetical protein
MTSTRDGGADEEEGGREARRHLDHSLADSIVRVNCWLAGLAAIRARLLKRRTDFRGLDNPYSRRGLARREEHVKWIREEATSEELRL